VSHGLGERSHVQKASRRQRLDLRLPHCYDVNRIPYCVEDLQRVTRFPIWAAWMVFNNGRHIPAPKPMLGEPDF
jgi:hypothetical protein